MAGKCFMLFSNAYRFFYSFYIQVFNPVVLLNLICDGGQMNRLFCRLVFMAFQWILIS